MKLKLQNILKIEEADIELGGLTVLTGENNSGKSTIGKALFTVLKAVNNVRQIDRIKTVSHIRRELFSIKRFFPFHESTATLLNDIQSLSVNLADKNVLFDDFRNDIENSIALEENLSARTKAVLGNCLNRIQQYILKLDNPTIAIKSEFELIARSEFMEPLNSYGSSDSRILFYDDTSSGSEIDIRFQDDKISSVQLSGNPSIEDITYIESPLYLHILNTLRMSSPIPTASFRGISGSLRKENIPFHLADMAEKILSVSEEFMGLLDENIASDSYLPLLDTINSIIGGEFILDSKTKQLSFNQDGHIVPPISVASGIKSFGVLQRLIQTGNVSTFKMLIWDEPEIHLHPEWQIVFCRLIVELVANGIPIVVSSHSPYFVQALRFYASARGIEKDVRYYMAEESQNPKLARIKEVTGDLNRVFTRLAAPLRDIMNVDAVRNSMR